MKFFPYLVICPEVHHPHNVSHKRRRLECKNLVENIGLLIKEASHIGETVGGRLYARTSGTTILFDDQTSIRFVHRSRCCNHKKGNEQSKHYRCCEQMPLTKTVRAEFLDSGKVVML